MKCKFLKSEQFDPRNNGLNLIRLLLAAFVIVSHAFALTGSDIDFRLGALTLGEWAVTGFFAISGYLIMASRANNRLAPYLMKRIARILPAYLVCLLVVALIFAPIAYVLLHGALTGYFATQPTPADYLLSNGNMALVVGNYTIGDTLSTVPFGNNWNGVLYTLYYEFMCYLIIGFLMCFSKIRKHPMVICGLFVVTAILPFALQGRYFLYSPHDPVNGISPLLNVLRFVPIFLGGASVYVLKDKIKNIFNLKIVALSVVAVVAVNFIPNINFTEVGIIAPFLLIISFWLAMKFKNFEIAHLTRVHDISYGIYIYGWVVQQMLMVLVVNSVVPAMPIWLNIIIVIIVTAGLATLSWVFIEKPVLNRARVVK